MSETWPGMTGNRHLVRIGIRAADEGTCPEQQAAKALPAVWPGQRSYVRKQFLNDFPLGAVMNALDDVEFRGLSREQVIERLGREAKPPLHPGAIRWARHAAVEYLDAVACIDTPATTPVPHYWVAQQARGEVLWELYAWGRRYASPDGTVREFRFIRFGEANMDKRDKGDAGKRGRARVAIAAYAAGTGQLVELLREWDVPARGVLGPMAGSVRQTWLDTGRWTAQYVLPVAAAGLAMPGGHSSTRLARRLALASLVLGPPAAEWLRSRPGLDPARFTLGYLADEAAYGAGVYRGALAERIAAPLLPRIAWRPLPRPARRQRLPGGRPEQ